MKKKYVFTDMEYNKMRASIASACNYITKLASEDYNNAECSAVYIDLKLALSIMDGILNFED